MSTPPSTPAFLQGGGAMGERIRSFDWNAHPLGAPAQWPDALRTALSICLHSSFPTAIYWGPDFHLLYNDAWSEVPADKHPGVLGLPARQAWDDIWDIVGPQLQQVFRSGEGIALYEQMLPMVRGGQPRETWWNYSFTAIRNADQTVGGVFNQGNEVTALVQARRVRNAEIARWHDMFRQAPAGIALLHGPGHLYEFANDAYLRLVGREDLVGRTVAEAIPEVVGQGYIGVLDQVYRSGEPFIGSSLTVKIQRTTDQPPEDRILDFIFRPVRDAAGAVDGIFILVTDVTDRARAETALRLTNWQLGEERARLASLIEAEQRAQNALRRFNDTLEAHVKLRTGELTRALQQQQAVTDRLRATFETSLMFQGFLETDGTLRDTNTASLAAIDCTLAEVVGLPFWETPWFTATPAAPERIRQAVGLAARGQVVQASITLELPGGPRHYDIRMRPAFNGQGEVIGIVPEALEVAAPAAADRVVLADVRSPGASPQPPEAGPSRTTAAP